MANLKHKAYDIIKENIITCRYQPGDFLNETQLIEEIGTSRTPIREALNKLEQEKLVRIVSKKGVMISELTLKEINDVYQMRIILEPHIILIWGHNIPLETLEDCLKSLTRFHPDMDMNERNRIDDLLHRAILDCCQNAYLNEWMRLLRNQNQRIRIMTNQLSRRMQENNDDHIFITKLLLRGEHEQAAQRMKDHLERSKQSTYDSLLNCGL